MGIRDGFRRFGRRRRQVQRTAREVFGWEELRPGQDEAMQHLLQGHDVLVVMPTGGGKSATYQIPAQLLDGPTIVISPLIALQRDQMLSLAERNAAWRGRGQLRPARGFERELAGADSRRSGRVRVPVARAARQAGGGRQARRGAALADRHRRGALRVGLGTRLPARLPPARPGDRPPGPPAGDRADRDRLPARTRGHRRGARPAEPTAGHPGLRPAQHRAARPPVHRGVRQAAGASGGRRRA